MADLKIKLKFGEFEFEIEGDKESVKTEFQLIRENGISKIIDSIKSISPEAKSIDKELGRDKEKPIEKNSQLSEKSKSSRTTEKKKAQRTPKLLTDLNLRPKGKTSLKDFYAKYEIKTNFERVVTFVYYLKSELQIENIGIDHIYTCYKEVGVKIPNIYQNLIDTKNRKGWIDTSNTDSIKLTIQGENYIVHEAPKSQKK